MWSGQIPVLFEAPVFIYLINNSCMTDFNAACPSAELCLTADCDLYLII